MNSLLKFMLVANLLLSVYCAQCPVGVTYTDILCSEGYSYSSITNLKIVNGYVCSDNSCTYTVSNGLISAVDYTMISKFDGQFNTIWGKALIGPVQQEAFQVTSDEKYIIFVPNQVSSCTVVKLNTNDGSFNLQNNLTPIVQCQSIQLSTDGASVYLAGYSTCPVLIQLNLSDLSIVNTKTHSSLQIVSIYFYSSSMLLINSINLSNTNYQISAVNMSLSAGMLSWGNKFGCTLFCSTPSTPILSLIWASTNQAFQLLVEGGKPVFFVVNLNTGAISGLFYKSAMSQTSITAADLVYTGSSTTIYILVRYSGGFHKFEYYPSSSTFSVGMQNTAVTGYFAAVMNGFTYFGGQLISNFDAFIAKIIGNGSIIQQQNFVLSSTSDTFVVNTSSGYGLSNDITIIVAVGVNPIISLGALAFVLPGSYTQSSTGIFRSDIIYRNEFQESLYVQENYSGKVEFQYPCSISGSISISSTLITHTATGTYPSWISLNSDYENINVNAPAYGGSNVYYFGVRSVIYGENIDKFATITIYKCLVLNCQSCSYTATNNCNICVSGYTLSSDSTLCTIQVSQSSQSTQTTPSSQSAQSANSQNTTNAPSDESVVSDLSYFSGGIIVASAVACIIGSTFGFSSPQGIWALFNQYQLVLVLPFLRANLSKEFLVFVKYLKFVSFSFSFVDNISFLNTPLVKNTFGYEQKDQVYNDNGLSSGSFIVNQFGLIRALLFAIVLHLCWLMTFKFICCSSQKIENFKQKVFNLFHFSTYIRLILEAFLFSFIAAFTEALRISDAINTSIPISSYLIGCIFMLFLIAFIVFIVAYYWRKKEKVCENEYFSELFEPFKKTHLAKQYYAVFTIRRVLIVLIIVLCKDLSNNYKLLIYLLLQFIAFIYAILVIPFVSKLDCVVEITNEIFYLAICALIAANHLSSSYTNILSIIILTLIILNGVIVCLQINSVSLYYLIRKCIKCCEKVIVVTEIEAKHEPKIVIIDCSETKNPLRKARQLESISSLPDVQNISDQTSYRIRRDSVATNGDKNSSKEHEDSLNGFDNA